MTRETFRRKLVKATGGCNIQHDGWPCNTCFHSVFTHDEWLAVLAYRGDYTDIPQDDKVIRSLAKKLQLE